MKKLLVAVAAAVAFLAQPALACPEGDCKNCPHHKAEKADAAATPAQAGKAEAKDQHACACAKKDGGCKCGDKCACGHAHEKAGTKAEPAKT